MIRTLTVLSERDSLEIFSDGRHRGDRKCEDLSFLRYGHTDRKRLAARMFIGDQLIEINLSTRLRDRRSRLSQARFCRKIGNSSRHGFSVNTEDPGASSHRNAGYEKRTQRLIDGPQALALLEVIGFVGPGAFAANTAILRDSDSVAFPDVLRITTSRPSTTRTFWIHLLGKSKPRAETAPSRSGVITGGTSFVISWAGREPVPRAWNQRDIPR